MTQDATLAALTLGCEAEKLHLSGAIQRFGALLRVDPEPPHRITHASANIATYLKKSVQDLLGLGIDATVILSTSSLAHLGDSPGKNLTMARECLLDGRLCDTVLLRGQDGILIEFEASESAAAPIALQELQKPLLSAPYTDDELASHHDTLAEAIRAITGYDRVMVYRFHEDWSGEVIAEATRAGMGSYLDLRFPASDIPAIARNLYLINPYRLIPDISAAPVDIVGLSGEPPDLTWSNLRSVSPVHLRYLANMGVGASFSVPIVIAGRLWGLVACHHLTARYLSPDQRNGCASLTRSYALGLTSHLASRRLQVIDSLDRRIDRLLETLAHHTDPLDGIEAAAPALMDTLNAQGIAMAIGDEVVIAGTAPDMAGMSLIDQWFTGACQEAVASTDCLATLFPEQHEALGVAGMLAIKARSPRSGWVRFYWFRPAEPQEVAWAGNPNKPVVENAGAIMLSPRRSFEKWVEVKTHYSRPWLNEERMTATKFRNTLLRWL